MMMQQLTHYLDNANIDYQTQHHSLAFTAQQIAEQCHVEGITFAKTVMVIIDAKLAMIVMPAPYTIDFRQMTQAIGCKHIHLAYEYQFRNSFADCETGAMPPFGNLFDMPVYVAKDLTEQPEIRFNAGDHEQVMQLRYADFAELVHPTVLQSGFRTASVRYQHTHARQGKVRH